MNIGISTASLFPMETENALDKLIEYKFDNFEIFINSNCELNTEFLESIKYKLIRNNLKIVSLHPYTSELENSFFFSEYSRRFCDGLEYYERYFQALKILGGKYVVLHGPKKENTISALEIGERLKRINDTAQKYNVQILIENVERCMGRNLSIFEVLTKSVPELNYVFDIKQAIRSEIPVYNFLDVLGTNLKHLHISDHSSSGDCMPIGAGKFDWITFLTYLKKHEFNGTLVIELYGNQLQDDQVLIDSKKNLELMLNAIL